ncbi:hypothetical protein L0156_14100 [bacterium]|nr:hypothetical protein [bacterium]
MNSKSKNELLVLIVLLALLSISVYSQFSSNEQSNNISSRSKSSSRGTVAVNEVLNVDSLSNEVPQFSGVKRNIFQFGAGAGSAESQTPMIRIPEAEPEVDERPSVPTVHYLGFYYEKESGLKLAALSNSGRIYVGRVGQILSGKYEVMQIADDHVILKVLNEEAKTIRVPLGKAPASFIDWKKEQEE